MLDEPFAALDKNLRLDMQIEIKRLQRQFGLTAIMVTHDQDEAMSIADRIAVMNRGKIEQLGNPVAIYDEPETLFVNDFIGSSNRFAGSVEFAEGETYGVRLVSGALWRVTSRRTFKKGDPVLVTVRPEQLVLMPVASPETIGVTLKLSLPIGGELIHDVETNAGESFKVSSPRLPGAQYELAASIHCALAPHAKPILFPRPAA